MPSELKEPPNVIKATPRTLKKVLKNVALETNIAVYISGQPGIGKSAMCQELAWDEGYLYYDIRPQLMERVDLMGIPYRDESGRTRWAAPGFFPAADDLRKHLINIEELSSARPDMMTALHQLIWDRRCGDHALPSTTRVVACGNRLNDRGHVHRMTTPIISRMVNVELEASFADWQGWALSHDVDSDVVFFLRFNNELFNKFEPETQEDAFPCPRTWTMLGQAKRQLESVQETEINRMVYAGAVGTAAANAFCAFLALKDELPDVDDVLLNPKGAPIPNLASAKIAICSSLCNVVQPDNFPAIAVYAERLTPEIGEFLVGACLARIPELADAPAMVMWAASAQL